MCVCIADPRTTWLHARVQELDDRSDWPMCAHLVAGAALTYLPLVLLFLLVYRTLQSFSTRTDLQLQPKTDARSFPGWIPKVILAEYTAVGLHWALGSFSMTDPARVSEPLDLERWIEALRSDLADTILPRAVYVAAISVVGRVAARCLVEAARPQDADCSAKLPGRMSERSRRDPVHLGVVVASALAGVVTMMLGPEKGALLVRRKLRCQCTPSYECTLNFFV